MSFSKPERALTEEEWNTLVDAATETASIYRRNSAYAIQDDNPRIARYWANKGDKIWKVILNLEDEYYKAHPDEDPDRRTNE